MAILNRPCLVCGETCQAELSESDNGVRIVRTIGEAWVILGGNLPGAPKSRLVCSDECRKKLQADKQTMDRLKSL